jgi:uncharacterized RDD family membrane protein YckC
VIGVRILAWIVDFVLIAGLSLLLSPFFFLGEFVPNENNVSNPCSIIRDQDDDVANCIELGDDVYFSSSSDTLIQFGATLAYGVVVFVLWQGLSGLTVGKALTGLRTVDENGQVPGIGRALVRTVLWIVDSQPCGIPLVGFFSGLTTTGHRRVGDMAAKTYVVRKADAGRPVVVPGATPAYGVPTGYGAQPGYGQPQPGYGAPVGYGQQQPTGYPTTTQPTATYPTAPPTADQWGAAPGTPAPGQGGWGAPGATSPTGQPPTAAPSGWPAAPGAPGQVPQPAPSPEPSPPPPTFGAGDRTYAAESPGAPGTVDASQPPTTPLGSGERPAVPMPAATSDTAGGPSGGSSEGDTGAAESASTPADATGEAPGDQQARAAEATSGETAGAPAGGETTAPAAAEPTQPAAAAQAAAQAQTYNPQWDAARGTYIQWDAARGQWLQWDDTAKQWRPI